MALRVDARWALATGKALRPVALLVAIPAIDSVEPKRTIVAPSSATGAMPLVVVLAMPLALVVGCRLPLDVERSPESLHADAPDRGMKSERCT